MRKKMILALLCITAFAAEIPVFADDGVCFVYEEFSEINNEWQISEDGVSLSKIPGSGLDTGLKLESADGADREVFIPINTDNAESFFVDFNIRCETKNLTKSVVIGNNEDLCELVNIKSEFSFGGKAVLSECDIGQWYNVCIMLDTVQKKIDYYINGGQVCTGELETADIDRMGFVLKGGSGRGDAVFIDDLRVYTGSEPKKFKNRSVDFFSTVSVKSPGKVTADIMEAYEQTELIAFYNFDTDTDENRGPAGWTSVTNGGVIGAAQIGTNHGYSVKLESTADSAAPILSLDMFNLDLKAETIGDVVFDFDVFFASATSMRIFSVKNDNNNQEIYLWRTTNAGGFAVPEREKTNYLGSYIENKWYNVQVIFKANEEGYYDKFDFYFDGKPVTKDLRMEKADFKQIKSLKFTQYNGGESSVCYFDNFKIYKGSEPVKVDLSLYDTPENEESEAVYETCFDNTEVTVEKVKPYILLEYSLPYALVYGEKCRIDKGNYNITPFLRNDRTYIPIRFISECMGAEVDYDSENRRVIINYDGSEIVFKEDYSGYFVNGREEEFDAAPINESDRVFIPARAVAEAFKKSIKMLDENTVAIGPKKDDFGIFYETELNTSVLKNALGMLKYERPKRDRILLDYNSRAGSNDMHPSVVANNDIFADVKNNIKENDTVKAWYNKLMESADMILNQPAAEYNLSGAGGTLLSISRQTKKRAEALGMAFLTIGDEKYKERLWQELEAVCAYPDWNHTNMLSNAEMSYAVSLAYDWLYDYWSDEQKRIIEEAVYKNVYEPVLNMYRNDLNSSWWAHTTGNWGSVTNGCMGITALTFMKAFPSESSELLEYAFRGIEYMIDGYAYDGGYGEGPGYWDYATKYLVYFINTLDNAMGSDYGYYDNFDGFSETAYFMPYMTGTVSGFNFHDASEIFEECSEIMWFARKENNAALAEFRTFLIKNAYSSSDVYDIMWYTEELEGDRFGLPYDRMFYNISTASFRSAWSDPAANYLGIHAGGQLDGHGGLDIGDFIIDADGVRWACELAMEDYSVPGYFNDFWRYTYYRARGEGQNTVVINPTEDPDQDKSSPKAEVKSFVSKPKGGFTIYDMTKAHGDKASLALRGAKLDNSRRIFTIQDYIEMPEKSEVYWFMHTWADINISEDGKSAVLISGNKKFYVRLLSDNPDIVFSQMKAEPLPSSPHPEQSENRGVNKLVIAADGIKKFDVSVVMGTDETLVSETQYMPLGSWSIPDGETELPNIDAFFVNGKKNSDYQRGQYEYNIDLPLGTTQVPEITVDTQYEYTVEKAENLFDATVIRTLNDSGEEVIYTFKFKVKNYIGKPDNVEEIPIVSAAASDEPQKDLGYGIEKTFDKDTSTRWSAEGPAWAVFDLGEIQEICGMGISWLNGAARKVYFTIEVSEDGENWDKVYDGESSGDTENVETTLFEPCAARYVRMTGMRNSATLWISPVEIEIYKYK